MILKASQRGGGMQLYRHLTNENDNDHVTLHDIRGFASIDPCDAVNEAYAVSLGTKCKQYLFSLSLSPPENEVVPVAVFDQAIADIEAKLGLAEQPRFIYFHEKEGRRHAHCVWSRIDANEMKAVNLPHFKLKLRDISRQQYLEHGWKMPRGLMNSEERNPLNFTLADLQQAKRHGLDPRAIKQTIQECWAVSDSKTAFSNVLKEHGYYLAQGNKARHVVVDWRGEVYALPRMLGIKAKDVRAKIGESESLPPVSAITDDLVQKLSDQKRQLELEISESQKSEREMLAAQRRALVDTQRGARQALLDHQKARWIEEAKARSSRLPTGIKALWFRVTGKFNAIKKQNEGETRRAKQRDLDEQQALIEKQKGEQRPLRHQMRSMRYKQALMMRKLDRYVAEVQGSQMSRSRERKRAVRCNHRSYNQGRRTSNRRIPVVD
ncbi:hypothetical protein IWQ54_002264 [Labrenzia sp. EL_195]|nr:hypothetical protein [Labrenzia sp. EL_195]